MKQLSTNQMIYSVSELKDLGYSYYYINQMLENRILTKLNKSFYESTVYQGDPYDFDYTKAYVPKGIVCLMSVAVHYQLTTYRPDCIDVAVQRNQHITSLPDWPRFQLYYYDLKRMEIGFVEVNENGNYYRITDLEKTVIDLVYDRNRIGIEEVKEVLKAYMQKKKIAI